jgi:hypothetical protein
MPDQQDAYAVARWMQTTDGDGGLEKYFHPPLGPNGRKKAEIEGWIPGVFVKAERQPNTEREAVTRAVILIARCVRDRKAAKASC